VDAARFQSGPSFTASSTGVGRSPPCRRTDDAVRVLVEQ
jgi:hypothetical protein